MKKIISISLGSSKRDHIATLELMNQSFSLQRIGTNGDLQKMIQLIRRHDGTIDAFGLGGMDIYIQAVDRRYTLRDAQKVAAAAKLTPIVDGTGLKNTLERQVVQYLKKETSILEGKKKVLITCAMDRFGLAQSLEQNGCEMSYGDLIYILNLPIPLKSLHTLALIARIAVPVIRLLPFRMIYPTGDKQEGSRPRHPRFFAGADIIAGDFHFIRRYMPLNLPGKIVITNTVTAADVELLRNIGVKTLITTTPEIEGRSFGTNVMEAVLVAYSGSKKELEAQEYDYLLKELDFKPRILDL
ncbi:MAG TPA: quinate 5-dehydrogenase [Firmicutes bacterium]|nr:quinate 5-dehydrogenase [Bacillota bacterium]